MRHLISYKVFEGSETRTSSISEEEFVNMIHENCTQFNFNNDMLYRGCGEIGEYALFKESERLGTYGNKYSYHDFFNQRRDYPVPRYKSIIGSTDPRHAGVLGQKSDSVYLVIPFDNSKIIFCPKPDMAAWDKSKPTTYSDDMFTMKEYSNNFKVSKEVEFFTNGNCLLYRLGAGSYRFHSYPSIPHLVGSDFKLNNLTLNDSMDKLRKLISK